MTRTAVKVTLGVRKAERFPISRQRKPGLPAHRPAGNNRLTRNEQDYYDAVLDAFAAIPNAAIDNQFIAPVTADVATPITESITEYQEYLGNLTLFQLDQSGTAIFNSIKRDVAAEWATLEKAETPSEFAAGLNFNRASPAAVSYASMSAANMVTDMVDTQITAVRNIVAAAYKDGLTRPQTTNRLIKLLNDMPAPRGTPAGLAGAANIFGDATRGLTNRYAMAVYHRCEKIMASNPTMTPKQLKTYANNYGRKLRASRARMIARTEMMRASNQGRLMGMIDAADRGLVNPVLAKKQWVTSRFDVCPICVPLNGVAVGIKESFGSPGQAPPAHPNCRCVIRMLPDPMTYGIPRSFGTGQPDQPLRFVRPPRPGLKLDELMPDPGDVAIAGPLVGQPGATQPTGVPDPVPDLPVSSVSEGAIDLAGKAYKEALEEGTETATDALIRHRAYDARPRVVALDELAELVDESPTGELRRQVGTGRRRNPVTDRLEEIPPNEIAEEFRQGKYFVGEGMHGRGTYVIEGTADDAVEYLSGRQATRGPHEIMEMTMDRDARVYEMPRKLQHKNRPFGDELHDRIGSEDAHDVLIALGYDAVRYPSNITVILNRSKVIVGRARNAQLDDIIPFPRKPVTAPPQRLATPSATEAAIEITDEVRAEGTALIKELREQARTSAQQQFDDVTGYLETLTDINMDAGGVLRRPPKVKWVRDPVLGRMRVEARTGQPPSGNWDWYWTIPEKQKVRMRRRGVFAEPGQKALGPDELTDKIMDRTAIQTEGEAIDLFLNLSQRRFTLASLKDGRGNLVKESIDNKMIPELEDSGFAWEILTGEIDDDVIAGVMKWATAATDDTVGELGRLLRRSQHGPNPWEMEINEYWTELYEVSQKRRAIQPLRVTDDFGPEYAAGDEAVIARFNELVPPNLIDDTSVIGTKEGIINLHLDIVEQATVEGYL